MQELTRKISTPAVCAVTGDGGSKVLEVDADLVRAPGFWSALEQRQLTRCDKNLPQSLGLARADPLTDGHALAMCRVTGNCSSCDTCGRAWFAAHHSKVSFLRRAGGELAGKASVGRVGFGDKDATTRVFIEAVNDARPQRMSA